MRVRYLGPATGAPPPTSLATAALSPLALPQPPRRLVDRQINPQPPVSVPIAAIPAPPAVACRIRAAAFADRANADRAVAMLSAQGYAHIEIASVGATILYRVDVDCPADIAPEAVLQRVISAGFPSAKVVTTS